MTRRAVILARGLGTRLRSADDAAQLTDAQRRAADAGLKALMPINGRPFLDYVLSALADAGLRCVALVVAPEHEALRRRYVEEARPTRVTIEFIVQPEPRGTADAVLSAEVWVAGEPFLVMNADNLYPVAALRDLIALDEPGLSGFDADDLVRSSNISSDRIGAFALVDVDRDGYLSSIVEKPAGLAAAASRISMNVWRFDARIFDACRDVPCSARGEFELPEAVGLAAARGVRFRVTPARGPVLDLSRRTDTFALEQRLRNVRPAP
jgi:dTDP-glucose pyrophosphorylase